MKRTTEDAVLSPSSLPRFGQSLLPRSFPPSLLPLPTLPPSLTSYPCSFRGRFRLPGLPLPTTAGVLGEQMGVAGPPRLEYCVTEGRDEEGIQTGGRACDYYKEQQLNL